LTLRDLAVIGATHPCRHAAHTSRRSCSAATPALAARLAELGATGIVAAAELARAGTPPADDLGRDLAEAARQFAAFRAEVLAAAATIELTTPPVDALASTRQLEPVPAALPERLQSRKRLGRPQRLGGLGAISWPHVTRSLSV
jgi:hypothetical protein